METINADQARTIRDFLLPSLEAEHKVTRMLIQAVPAEALDFKPDAGGKTMSELMWYLVLAEHHSLIGICDAQFAAPPQKPEQSGADAVLAWDDEHFPQACQRLVQLSGEDLLRPVEFLGSTRPAIEFLPLSMSLILQHRGQLAVYLRMSAAASVAPTLAEQATASQTGAGELSDSELAAAVGGTVTQAGFGYITITTMNPQQAAQQMAREYAEAHPSYGGGLLSGLLQAGSPSTVIATSLGVPAGVGGIAGLGIFASALSIALEMGSFAFF